MSTAPHTTNPDTTETAITMSLLTPRVVSVVTLSTPLVVSVVLSEIILYFTAFDVLRFVIVNE
jgi:hypothetical protein